MTDPNGWRKSSRSAIADGCVEIRPRDGGVDVRDSKNPGSGSIYFPLDPWRAFIDGAKNGEFDPT